MSSLKFKKNILFVTPLYRPAVGGAATYFSTLSDYLKNKAQVFVLTTYYKGEKFIEKKDTIRLFRIIPNVLVGNRFLRYITLPIISFLATLVLSLIYRPKCIHCHSGTGIALGPLFFSYISKIPLFLDVQDLFTPAWILKIGRIKKYVAFGPAVEKRLLELGIKKSKIRMFIPINPPIVDIISKIKKQKSKRFRIISIGELSKIKGVDILLKAFKLIYDVLGDNVSLIILGDGPEKKYCENYIKQNSLQSNIKLLGRKDYKTTLIKLRNSDLVIIASRSESWCRIIIEAFRLKVPVIATNVGGIPFLIKNNINGFLVTPEDPNGIASAAINLYHHKELRNKFINNGINFVDKMQNWKQLSDKIYEMYNIDEK